LAYGKVWTSLHGVKDSVHQLQKNTIKPIQTPQKLQR
jgi:hypothetical protein